MEWLERGLVIGPYLQLCLSEAEFKKVLKHFNIKENIPWIKSNNSHAAVHSFLDNAGLSCILCLRDENRDIEVIYGLIVHEAVHIWQRFKTHIGEEFPSKEFEAYSIQAISQRLFYAYKKQSKIKRKKK